MQNNNNLPNGTKRIPLNGKIGVGKFAIVDAEDYDKLVKYRWFWNRGYAVRIQHYTKEDGLRTTRTIYMHRVIMNPPEDKQIDHRNHNKLDNRKNNLRICTPSENMKNQHHKGYYYNNKDKRWTVSVKIDGKWAKRNFKTEEEAKAAAKLVKSGVIPDKKVGHRNKLLPKYISPNVCNGRFMGYYFRCVIDGVVHRKHGLQNLTDALAYRDRFFQKHNINILRKENT